MLVVVLAAAVGGDGPTEAWPPFLPPAESLPAELVAAVERVWREPTLSRTVRGRPARVPFDVYVAFVDSPEVTAAAARFRQLARYEVRALGDDAYEADDGDGARGVYRVLVREATRRVMLSRGEHSGLLLGAIRGSALTVLALEPRDREVAQTVTAYVRIDNRVAAALARLLVAVFGFIADRKLAETFTVSAAVAEWAVERPDEFCPWLDAEPLPTERREAIRGVLLPCRATG